ncbi:MAG: hypothetical protein K8S00_07225, partial [Bacteroidales bacterium]|nr:hypothetical protein [Bacteroidales bacterium]
MIKKSLKSSLAHRNWEKFLKNKLAIIGSIILIIMLIAIIFAPLITSYDPNAIDLKYGVNGPSANHILGTDKLGRDVFARLLYG